MNTGKIINLTPHSIVVITARGQTDIPPSGKVARVAQKPRKEIATIGSTEPGSFCIPVVPAPEFEDVDWPEFDQSAYCGAIVSLLVGQRVEALEPTDRPSFAVFSPDTSPGSVVRDYDGNIEGVSALNVHSWGKSSGML